MIKFPLKDVCVCGCFSKAFVEMFAINSTGSFFTNAHKYHEVIPHVWTHILHFSQNTYSPNWVLSVRHLKLLWSSLPSFTVPQGQLDTWWPLIKQQIYHVLLLSFLLYCIKAWMPVFKLYPSIWLRPSSVRILNWTSFWKLIIHSGPLSLVSLVSLVPSYDPQWSTLVSQDVCHVPSPLLSSSRSKDINVYK